MKLPEELWVDNEERNASAFHIRDPLERFEAVNAASRAANAIDLHYQSTATVLTVLDDVLWPRLQEHGTVWVITGTGHHVAKGGHQKRGAALFNAVQEYLVENAYEFALAKDRQGLAGAFRVSL